MFFSYLEFNVKNLIIYKKKILKIKHINCLVKIVQKKKKY